MVLILHFDSFSILIADAARWFFWER